MECLFCMLVAKEKHCIVIVLHVTCFYILGVEF